MKRKYRLAALVLLAVAIAAALVGALILETRYGAILRSPRTSYAEVTGPQTRIQAVVRPPLLEARLKPLYPPLAEVPDWILHEALPREVAIVVDTDLEKEVLTARLFVNEQRFGPILVEKINEANWRRAGPLGRVRWKPARLVRKKRGMLLLSGEWDITPETAETMWDRWPYRGTLMPLTLDGGHLFEVALDNRDGGIYPFFALLRKAGYINEDPESDQLPEMVQTVLSVRATGDFVSEDVVRIAVRIQCRPDVDSFARHLIKFAVEEYTAAYGEELKYRYGVDYTADISIQDDTIVALYEILNARELVRRLL